MDDPFVTMKGIRPTLGALWIRRFSSRLPSRSGVLYRTSAGPRAGSERRANG